MGDMIDELAEAAKKEWFIPTRPLRDETEGERFKRIVKTFLIAALADTQARADKLERERNEAYDRLGEEITELRNDVRAAETRAKVAERVAEYLGKIASQRGDELITIQAELSIAQQSSENWRNRCLAAEARAAAIREATIEECAKVAEREYQWRDYDGTTLIGRRFLSGPLAAECIRALKTVGKD